MSTTRKDVLAWTRELTKLERRITWLYDEGYKPKPSELERCQELKRWISRGTEQLNAAAAAKPAPLAREQQAALLEADYLKCKELMYRLHDALEQCFVPEEAIALRLQLDAARSAHQTLRWKRRKQRLRFAKGR